MEFYSPLVWKGLIRVTPLRYNLSLGAWVPAGEGVEFPNLITNLGKDLFAEAITNGNTNTQISYLALGSSNTVAAATDTTLVSEQFRKQITAYNTGVSTGQVVTNTYVAPGEANSFTIEELGWFAEDASATTDSGTLVARVATTVAKDASTALQIERTDTFS